MTGPRAESGAESGRVGAGEVDPLMVERISANLAVVRQRIAAAGGGPEVRVLAVTKRQPPEVVIAALAAGLDMMGENYVQELVAKARALDGADVRWHMIGQLQTNKVRQIASVVSCVQTVDRASLVAELARRAPGSSVMVQVDLAGIEGRGGCSFEQVDELVEVASRDLAVVGLMGVAPPLDGPGGSEAVGESFQRLAATRDRLGLAELSMGMTADLELAVGAGATMVRVGTALFGART